MRRSVLFFVVLLAVSLLPLSAFAGGGGEEVIGVKGEPLEFYGWDFMPTKIQEYCASFAEKHNQKVNVHIVPGPGYTADLQTKFMGGARVDVAYNYAYDEMNWVDLGWARSMSGMPDADKLVADIVESAKPNYFSDDGQLISLPYFITAFVEMYNEKMLKAAGYDHFPKSKDEQYQICAALKQKGISNPYVAYWDKHFIDRYFFVYLMSEGITVFDKNYNPVFQNDPESVRVMNWWVKMYADGCTSPTILTDSPTDSVVMMQEGTAAFFNLHDYFVKTIRQSGAREATNVIMAARVPGKIGTSLQEGEVLQMGGKTPDPEMAWKLIRYYSWKNDAGEYQVPKTWALAAGLLVPYKGFFNDQEIVDSFKQWTDWPRLLDLIANGSRIEPVRMRPWYPEWKDQTATILHKMLLREMSVEDAIAGIADAAVKAKTGSK